MQPAGRYRTSRGSAAKRNGPFGYRLYTIIYAIDAPEIGRIKFGRTLNVERRFRGIASMSPAPVVLLGHAWMPDDAEGYVFGFLKEDHSHGEWFHRTEKVRSVAALIAAKRVEQLAEVLGMQHMLAEHLPSGVSWGAR